MSNPNPRMQYVTDAGPFVGAVAITGSAQTLTTRGRALYITTQGDITFTMEDGTEMEITGLPVGRHDFTVRAIETATAAGYVLL